MLSRTPRLAAVLALTAGLAAGSPARAADVDKALPNDTTSILSFNLKQLLDSPLVKQHALAAMKQAIASDAGAEQAFKALGVNPFTDFDRLTIAITGTGTDAKPLILVKGNFDPKKLDAAAQEEAKKPKAKIKVVTEGQTTMYEMESPNPQLGSALYAAVADKSTLVMGTTKAGVKNAVDGKGGKLKKEVADLLEKADAKQTMFMLAIPSADDLAVVPDPNLKKTLEKVEAITGNVMVEKDVQISLNVNTKDEAAAKEIAGLLKLVIEQGKQFAPVIAAQSPELKPLAELVNSLKAGTAAKTVTLSASLTAEYLEKTLKKDK
jgi:hypothetical protein